MKKMIKIINIAINDKHIIKAVLLTIINILILLFIYSLILAINNSIVFDIILLIIFFPILITVIPFTLKFFILKSREKQNKFDQNSLNSDEILKEVLKNYEKNYILE